MNILEIKNYFLKIFIFNFLVLIFEKSISLSHFSLENFYC